MTSNSLFADDESLLDPNSEVDHRVGDYKKELDSAADGYDPHGRHNGFRGEVHSPLVAEDGDPMSPINGPVTVDLVEEERSSSSSDDDDDKGEVEIATAALASTDATMEEVGETTSTENPTSDSEKPEEELAPVKKSKKRTAETVEEPVTKRPRTAKKKKKKKFKKRTAETTAEEPTKKKKSKPKSSKKERRRAKREARRARKQRAAEEEEEEEEDAEEDAAMVDEVAAVDEEMYTTKAVRTFVERVYNLPAWRSDAKMGSDDWMALAFVSRELRNDSNMSLAFAQSGYRNIEELLLGSCGQTLVKMVSTARKRAHLGRTKGKPEAVEIDGLAAKFIENSWHFRIYANIIQQYEAEGFVDKKDRSLGEIPDEDYEEDSFCVDDDGPVDQDDVSNDEEYAEAKRRHKRDKKKAKAKKKKKKRTDDSDDEAKQRSRARRLTQALEDADDGLDTLLDEPDAVAASAAAVVEAAEKSKGKGRGKNIGEKKSSDAWDADAIDSTVASPKTEWASYRAVHAAVWDALIPTSRLGADMPDGEFDTMLTALLKIARHVLTPLAAAIKDGTQMMSIVSTVGKEVTAVVDEVRRAEVVSMKSALAKKPHFMKIAEFVMSTAAFVDKITVPSGGGNKKMCCIWTGTPVKSGQDVFRVRAFSRDPKNETQAVRVTYVAEAPGDHPERFVLKLSALRAHRNWHFVFMRKLFEWQSREYFSESVTADMRMQRFLNSTNAIECAAITLAEFFAIKHVVGHWLGDA